MDNMMEKIVAYEEFLEDTEKMMEKAERLGDLIIIKDNKPVFQIFSVSKKVVRNEKDKEEWQGLGEEKRIKEESKFIGLTLKGAVLEVLDQSENKEMHVSEIADLIYSMKLYKKKDGSKAHYTQIRAMCGQHPEEFETLPRNRVKLKE